jgi:hypothetical protein
MNSGSKEIEMCRLEEADGRFEQGPTSIKQFLSASRLQCSAQQKQLPEIFRECKPWEKAVEPQNSLYSV